MIGVSRISEIIFIFSASSKFFHVTIAQNCKNIPPKNAIMQSFYYDTTIEDYRDISSKDTSIEFHEKQLHIIERFIYVKMTKCRIANFHNSRFNLGGITMRNDMVTTGHAPDFVEHPPPTCSWTSRIVLSRQRYRKGLRKNQLCDWQGNFFVPGRCYSRRIDSNGGI